MMKEIRTNKLNLLIVSALIALFSFTNSSVAVAASSSGDEGEGEESKTEFIMHHISDDYQWHIITLGDLHVTIPLPIILYDYEEGLKVFMSSDFYDEHHEPIAHEG